MGIYIPAVPEAVAGTATLADLLLALGSALLWVVCLGLLWAYRYTIGAQLEGLANALDSVRVWKFHIPTGPIRSLDHGIQVALSKGVSTMDHAMGLFFHWAGLMLAWMANFAMRSAQDTLALANWVTHIHLPKYAKWAIRAAFPLAWLTKLIAQEITKALPKVGHIAKAAATSTVTVVEKIPRAIDRRLTKAEKRLAALAAALVALGGAIHLPHHVTTPGDVWRGLTKRLARLERRMTRLEKLLGVAAMAAAMANVLGLPNWRCLTRGNIGRGARAFCGLDKWIVDLLLLGSVEAFIVTDLCKFTDLLIAEAEQVVPVLMTLVDVEDALIGCHGTVKPLTFNLPPASLPPLQGVSPLAA